MLVFLLTLVLLLDEAQFGPEALTVAREAAVLLQQFAVLLDQAGRALLLPVVLLKLRIQLLSEDIYIYIFFIYSQGSHTCFPKKFQHIFQNLSRIFKAAISNNVNILISFCFGIQTARNG